MQATTAQSGPSAGPAVLLTWCDIPAEEEPAFTEWYNREHMRDRVVALPGFRYGRRFIAVNTAPKYLAFYVAHNAAVFSSDEYVALITRPDPNSHHFIMRFQNTIRTIAWMSVSVGEGEGAMISVLPLTPAAGRADAARRVLADDLLPRIQAAPGIIAARLLERDPTAGARSRSGHVRQGDRALEWAVVVEAGEAAPLEAVAQAHLGDAVLQGLGLARQADVPVPNPSIFRQLYRVAP